VDLRTQTQEGADQSVDGKGLSRKKLGGLAVGLVRLACVARTARKCNAPAAAAILVDDGHGAQNKRAETIAGAYDQERDVVAMPKHGIGDKCAGGVGGSPKPETYTRHGTSRGRRVCFVSIC